MQLLGMTRGNYLPEAHMAFMQNRSVILWILKQLLFTKVRGIKGRCTTELAGFLEADKVFSRCKADKVFSRCMPQLRRGSKVLCHKARNWKHLGAQGLTSRPTAGKLTWEIQLAEISSLLQRQDSESKVLEQAHRVHSIRITSYARVPKLLIPCYPEVRLQALAMFSPLPSSLRYNGDETFEVL